MCIYICRYSFDHVLKVTRFKSHGLLIRNKGLLLSVYISSTEIIGSRILDNWRCMYC